MSVWGALRGAVGLALAMIVKGQADFGKIVVGAWLYERAVLLGATVHLPPF